MARHYRIVETAEAVQYWSSSDQAQRGRFVLQSAYDKYEPGDEQGGWTTVGVFSSAVAARTAATRATERVEQRDQAYAKLTHFLSLPDLTETHLFL